MRITRGRRVHHAWMVGITKLLNIWWLGTGFLVQGLGLPKMAHNGLALEATSYQYLRGSNLRC